MNRELRIGLLGCGVVGQGVLRLLKDNAASIEARLGAKLRVVRIAARDLEKAKKAGVDATLLTTHPEEIVRDPNVDIVVELMGGLSPTGDLVRAAIERRKAVVTANKALLAEQGQELFALAEERSVDLAFEGAVAGGIPIIRVLREALASDRVLSIRGIVNGTSNYILTRMHDEGIDFAVALKGAQEAGYAEADPTLDVGGGDAAHKLTILATLAFGARISYSQVSMEGITNVSAVDIHFARRFGYVIKSLGVARIDEHGALDLRVHPTLVSQKSPLANVNGALNAVYLHGAALGPCFLSGAGAGSLPTAVSVVSDIVDVGRNLLVSAQGRVPERALRTEDLVERPVQDSGAQVSRYYLRFSVADRPGVLGRIASVLGAYEVSIEHMVQEGHNAHGDAPVTIVMITHHTRDKSVRDALREIGALEHVVADGRAIRIDEE